jgi:hypothetical protein
MRLTPELTGRADNAITDKFSIKAVLFALRLNELLDRPLIVSLNSALAFLILATRDSTILFTRSVSNARINPARA